MLKRYSILILFVLVTLTVAAQKTLTGDEIKSGLLTPYTKYFTENREMVYTQFNKSQYLTGDDIWFTSWVLNAGNKQPIFNTSKLYVELWSVEKKMISRKILYVKGGTTSNFIHISDSLAPGTYCFRSYTNWMRNFYDDKDFNVPINILGPAVKKTSPVNSSLIKSDIALKDTLKPIIKPDFDIQFLPEGGHFIEGVDNVFGVKITDASGHGVLAKGKIVDTDNKEIISFTTSQLGMTSFTIAETQNTIYHSVLTLPDGNNREIKLPETEKQGVAINVKSHPEDEVWVRLQINPLARSLNQAYVLMVHANGVKYHLYKIDFTTVPFVMIKMNRNDLGNGIIYATLFNEDFKPIAERLFYNQNKVIRGSLSLKTTALANDSIKLTVSASDSSSKAQIANLSFSVLPGETRMNKFTTSLLAESRLRPALKGDIENPGYYFEKNDSIHLQALDNLMLTQGWRKYDWQEITKNVPNHFIYPEENAFTINGSVKNWIRNKPELKSLVSLVSPLNKITMQSTVDEEGKFSFNNLYLADSSYAIIYATSINGGSEWNRVLQTSMPESKLEAPVFNPAIGSPSSYEWGNEDIPKLTKGVIRLSEVLVTAKKKDPYIQNIFLSQMANQFEINKDNYWRYSNMEELLRLRFNVRVIMVHDRIKGKDVLCIDMQRAAMPDTLKRDPPNTGDLKPWLPIMTVNGVRIWDPLEFLAYNVGNVESVAVDKSGITGGFTGEDGVIALTTRTTPLFDLPGDDTNIKRWTIKGYAPPKEFFEPKYLITPENPDYSRYATLYWRPEVVTDINGTASFSFNVPNALKSIFIRAEGINDDGLIFLHDEKIALPGRENDDN
jgi:hypothetical protein